MDTTLVLFEKRYKFHISKDFGRNFFQLPEGRYVYEVQAVDQRSWGKTNYVWRSKIYDERGVLVKKNSLLCELPSTFDKCAFIAELIDYTLFYYYEFEGFNPDYSDDWYFHPPFDICHAFELLNFKMGDNLLESDFEAKVHFEDNWFDWTEKTFKKMGIDTNKYKHFNLYSWVITKNSAKLYYHGIPKELLYVHPEPTLMLATFGWYMRHYAK